MELLDRQPSENTCSYALRVLLYSIITLKLVPDNAANENEFSLLLKFSRTPARGTLTELSKTGLVDIQFQRGSYTTRINYELIEESHFMHLMLENAVLKLVREGISQEYETLLRANLEGKIRYLNAADCTRLFELDTDFHRLLFPPVGKERTYGITHFQMMHFGRLRASSLKSLKPDKIVEDHENILCVIGRRDSRPVGMLVTWYLTRRRMKKSELVECHPGYFA